MTARNAAARRPAAIKLKIFFAALLALFLTASCEAPGAQAEFALGTLCAVDLFEGGSNRLYDAIFARIREIDRTMTAHPPAAGAFASDVAEIGRWAGIAPVSVGEDLLDVLERALHFAEMSDGAFDPTIGPLTALWGIGTHSPRVPSDAEIAGALALVNWRDLEINRAAGTAFLRRQGMSLDLGAIAKGFAGDEAARITREAGVRRALIDLGGNIVAVGWRQRRGSALRRLFSRRVHADLPWRIGIQHPLRGRGVHMGIVEVFDTSVVTSGVNERFFEAPVPGGAIRRFHHLLCTRTGFPVENGLLSVTVVAQSSTDADALSTAAFALGYHRGRAVIDSMPGAEAIFVFADRRVRITDGLAGVFRLTVDEFTLAP